MACPGMFDQLAIIAGRTWRDVPLASMLNAVNTVVLVLALALLARVIYKVTSSVLVAIAITVAASATTVFAVTLAPSSASACLVSIAAWSAVLRTRQEPHRAPACAVALGLLAWLAVTVTPMMLPVAIVAGTLPWKRWHLRIVAVLTVLGASHLIQMALPQGHSCVMPHGGVTAFLSAVKIVGGALGSAGPLATALAILGLFAIMRLPRGVALSLPVLVVASIWGAAVMPARPEWILAPFAISFWLLAAAGLTEIWGAASNTMGGKAGVAALSVVLVVLQVLAANARRLAESSPEGHDRLTLAMMSELVSSLPPGAALVAEDATVSLLARALPSRVRPPARFHFVAPDVTEINGQLGNSRVFALPRSQRVLQHVGLELSDATVAGVSGMAEVRQAHACTADLAGAPITLPAVMGRQVFALVAADERTRDRVVIALAGDVPLSVSLPGWTPEAMRGIDGRMFDLTLAADQRVFAEELRTYGLSSWSPEGLRYVTRLEVWRTAGAPLVLPVALSAPARAGTARLIGTARDQHLRLCPSFPYDVRPIRRP